MANRRLRKHIQETVSKPRKSDQKVGVGFTPHAHLHRGPEEAFQGSWTVTRTPDDQATGSFTDKGKREAGVPLGPTRVEELVRLHEAEHLTASHLPETKKKLARSRCSIGDRELRLMEEIRVNGRLQRRGHSEPGEWVKVAEANRETIPELPALVEAAKAARTITHTDSVVEGLLARTRLGLAASRLGDCPVWFRDLAQCANQLYRYPDDWPTFRRLAQAVKLAERKRQVEQRSKQTSAQIAATMPGKRSARNARERASANSASQLRAAEKELDELEQALGLQKTGQPITLPGGGHWGTMRTVKLPMPITTTRPGEGRKWRVTDQPTSRITRPHRLVKWGDQLGFSRRPKRGGTGSFLVDVSGSMRWELEDLQDLLDAMPRANVALYAGTYDRGTLVIVAQGGKRATRQSIEEATSDIGGNNLVDGPALEWLSTQPEPRVWISDGVVTAVGVGCTEGALASAAGICRRGKIRRVEHHELMPNRGEE